MDAERFVLALLNTVPENEVKGKKRLQKLVFLLKEAGASCDAEFRLRDFGPYSHEIEHSTSYLSFIGDLEEREQQVGYASYLASVYTLSEAGRTRAEPLPDPISNVLSCLSRFTTLELEIASTIRYFERLGDPEEKAISRTHAMKPSKTKDEVVKKARAALGCLR